MNSTFKVVFNKARGALMVVNEVTSSVQGKGTKTVVAAAVATMLAGVAGSTMAAEWQDAPETLTPDTNTVQWTDIEDQNSFVHTPTGDGEKTVPLSWMSVTDNKTFDKTLWVTGVGSKAQSSGFGVSGEGVTFTNKGTIYATSGENGVNFQNDAIWAGNGATAINEGKIVAKDAYGMRVGKDGLASKIVNNGSIYVESSGVGMELGGAKDSEAVNNGLISVGEVAEDKFGHGVLIQDQEGARFTNEGTITAGKGASAIEIKKHAQEKVTTAKVVLKGNSKVDGLIHVGEGVKAAVISVEEGVTDTLTLKAENVATGTDQIGTKLKVMTGSAITLADKQDSKLAKVVVDETSRLNLSISEGDNTVKEAKIKGILNITKLNSRLDGKTDANLPKDQLLIDRGQSFTYDHAQMYVDGKVFTGNLKVGRLTGSNGIVTFKGGDHSFTKLTVGANGSAFNVEEGAVVTVGGLHLYHGSGEGAASTVTVNGSTLINTGALTFEKADSTYTVEGKLELANGTFQTAATDFFKKQDATAADAEAKPVYVVTGNEKFLSGNGTLNLTSDAFEFTLDDLKAAQGMINPHDQSKTNSVNDDIKLVFVNGTLKAGETLTADKVDNLSLTNHDGVATDSLRNS